MADNYEYNETNITVEVASPKIVDVAKRDGGTWRAAKLIYTAINPRTKAPEIKTKGISEMTLSTLTPTRRAIVISCCVARIALPIRVYLINTVKPTILTALVTRMTNSGEPIICAIGSINSKSGI